MGPRVKPAGDVILQVTPGLLDNLAVKREVEAFLLDLAPYPQPDCPVDFRLIYRLHSLTHHSAAASVSPVRILTACSRLKTKILPSPI